MPPIQDEINLLRQVGAAMTNCLAVMQTVLLVAEERLRNIERLLELPVGGGELGGKQG
jgi:hypothetical protein